jgi:hypothetical protein
MFICVNKILRKYDLDNPIKISRWISLVKSRVNDHWCTQLTTLAQLYKGLQYLRLVYKRLGPDSSSVMTGCVLVSFSGRVLVVQEVLRTVIIANDNIFLLRVVLLTVKDSTTSG